MGIESKNRWALLIGIDCYMANQLPDGSWYPSLGGCVRDIAHVESFLRTRLGVEETRLLKLTASNPHWPPNDADPDRRPLEAPENWPTYENMVHMFRQLTEMAAPGDQVYIHYSGHGGRATTAFPALKGDGAFDEALVPTDIGDSTARYLRDAELAYLLQAMVDKGLLVTVVFDSCHSGGATRGNGKAVRRGIGSADTRIRNTDSLVATYDRLEAVWRGAGGSGRSVKPGSGWLIEPEGYVLLAACRAQESAFEYPFDGKERNGALTYWLLDSLKQIGPALTYKMLHDRILAKIHAQFAAQTPQLQGEGARLVFGCDRIEPAYGATVLEVDAASGRARINAGEAHFIRRGAQFAIYPHGSNDLASAQARLALAELQEDPSATDAWVTITHRLKAADIEQGAQAVLIDPGIVRLRRPVALALRDDLSADIDQQAALQRARDAIVQRGSAFAPLATETEGAAFQVAVNANSEYEIWDPAGAPLTNLRPALQIDDPAAPATLVERLIHLAKYRNVQELDNHDTLSPLAGQLAVELAGMSKTYNRADAPEPQPFPHTGTQPVLKPGEWVFLRIRNLLPRVTEDEQANVLNVTVLGLDANWAISQLHPRSSGSYFVPLDPQSEILLPLQVSLPPGCKAVTDIIKVFGTIGTTNFRWLGLPALDRPIGTRSTVRGQQPGGLEALLAAIVEQEPRTRGLNTMAYASEEWVTAHVEVATSEG
jgi:hypothetical protein